MSNYCKNCEFNVKEKTGEQACPFNYLYWHFIARHENKLSKNPRMTMIYRTMAKIDKTTMKNMLIDGDQFLGQLEKNQLC